MRSTYSKIFLYLTFAILLLSTAKTVAQTKITGQVLDQYTQEAVIGATVLQKDTYNGTVTDLGITPQNPGY
ncbi:MAG: carboxypeptidase-like regulatory domain-containing protein [Tannerellaceae bacterium]|nr:carboxypeptidase-like regulatory domain-containing protein [Tannerellaceae bacterium]